MTISYRGLLHPYQVHQVFLLCTISCDVDVLLLRLPVLANTQNLASRHVGRLRSSLLFVYDSVQFQWWCSV